MANGISSRIPYQGYPHNAVGATPMTKDIASYCYDTQRNSIEDTYVSLASKDKPSYTWPIIGAVVSFASLLTVAAIKRGRP